MGYMVNINGIDVMIEHEETTDNRNRLLGYYQKLIAAKGVTLQQGRQGNIQRAYYNFQSIDNYRMN